MGIRIIAAKNSKGYRPWWYGEYREDGKLKSTRLDVKIEGVPPDGLSTKGVGSIKFERSKAKAQAVFDAMMEERQKKGASEGIMQNLLESKTGEKVHLVRMDELADCWNGIPRARPLTEGREKSNRYIINEFAAFCKRTHLYEVTVADVTAYLSDIRKRMAWSSVTSRMSLLSGAFNRFLPHGYINPFKSIIKRDVAEGAEQYHSIPLTSEELGRVRDAAKSDPFLYPIIECAICTGARLKDICYMKKSNIDLKDGFVTYLSSKTNRWCELPLFPSFRNVCEDIIYSTPASEPLLFPDAASLYERNRSELEKRCKLLLARVLFEEQNAHLLHPAETVGESPLPALTQDEVFSLIDQQNYTPTKKARMKEVCRRYIVEKESYRQIEANTKILATCTCGYLQEIESLTGRKIIRFDKAKTRFSIADMIGWTRKKRTSAGRAVSLYGWRTFRATFCVLAILHGVPEKQILNAVGHSTFKTTMTYYNNPTRAHIKESWEKSMAATAIGKETPALATTPNLQQLVDKLTPEQRMNLALLLQKQVACA